jgi:polyhydroxyalkanoate synthesis regulator phasin
MTADLQEHLQKAKDLIVHAAKTGDTLKVPYTELRKVVRTLVKEGVLTENQSAGVLTVDGRVVHEAWKKSGAR